MRADVPVDDIRSFLGAYCSLWIIIAATQTRQAYNANKPTVYEAIFYARKDAPSLNRCQIFGCYA